VEVDFGVHEGQRDEFEHLFDASVESRDPSTPKRLRPSGSGSGAGGGGAGAAAKDYAPPSLRQLLLLLLLLIRVGWLTERRRQ
jgi:hypothetical protein